MRGQNNYKHKGHVHKDKKKELKLRGKDNLGHWECEACGGVSYDYTYLCNKCGTRMLWVD